jgi:TolA-binding protein
VSELVSKSFVPVRIHVKEQPGMWKRFGIRWTPTVLILSPDGNEQYRIEGSLPANEFAAKLELGLGYVAVNRKKWDDAEREFSRVVDEHPETEAAPEALYWNGVAKYSATRDGSALQETSRQFKHRYQKSTWAQRASVWG